MPVDSLSSLAPPRFCLRFQEIGPRSGGSAFLLCRQMKGTADPPGRIRIDGTINSYACGLWDDSFNSFQPGTKYRRLAAYFLSILSLAKLDFPS